MGEGDRLIPMFLKGVQARSGLMTLSSSRLVILPLSFFSVTILVLSEARDRPRMLIARVGAWLFSTGNSEFRFVFLIQFEVVSAIFGFSPPPSVNFSLRPPLSLVSETDSGFRLAPCFIVNCVNRSIASFDLNICSSFSGPKISFPFDLGETNRIRALLLKIITLGPFITAIAIEIKETDFARMSLIFGPLIGDDNENDGEFNLVVINVEGIREEDSELDVGDDIPNGWAANGSASSRSESDSGFDKSPCNLSSKVEGVFGNVAIGSICNFDRCFFGRDIEEVSTKGELGFGFVNIGLSNVDLCDRGSNSGDDGGEGSISLLQLLLVLPLALTGDCCCNGLLFACIFDDRVFVVVNEGDEAGIRFKFFGFLVFLISSSELSESTNR
ncbi:hypothetical protein BCR41DRAFT_372738 [Lobosporangium transversale]|uniref:Uncharacterized protein n=1 Tax=Lobosporangium transversale TaxID=64571 RepID=A0A1Y2GFX8_9FUNG|nr:hypothetical protein BCR41DRAFT_372738 [Lobosporangium transversale]ORZ09712.1 hypothetical protein BCR41DRAFT_372738 [Lobosporangium transversale]|eukprot:XP_021878982.1 hypothetical protein BCR41DRAFT_372738 [Lobosporangium transversale]